MAQRQEFGRLIALGVNNSEAINRVGVNRRTGTRPGQVSIWQYPNIRTCRMWRVRSCRCEASVHHGYARDPEVPMMGCFEPARYKTQQILVLAQRYASALSHPGIIDGPAQGSW